MYKKILIVFIIIALLVLGGLIVFSNGNGNANTDTKINFLSNKTLKNGDSIQFELTDSKGNALANQELKITFASSEGTPQNFTIKTDSQGKGSLVLNEQADGNYTIIVTYEGNGDYKGCSEKQTITVGAVKTGSTNSTYAQTQSSSNATGSSSSNLHYDKDLNVYYDSNGIIRGGQNDGANYQDIKNRPAIDENGNLV